MLSGQEGGPPFIRGLLLARKTLLELRQKKLREAGGINSHIAVRVDNYLEPTRPVPEAEPSPKSVETPQEEPRVDKGLQLRGQMNEIGSTLHSKYIQNQALETVFGALADHYRKHLHLVEQNESLKRQQTSLNEQTEQYQVQISRNYAQIDTLGKQSREVELLTGQELAGWLREQAEREAVEPVRALRARKGGDIFKEGEEDEEEVHSLKLGWKALSQSLKKPPLRKNISKPQEQDLRSSLYSSQLYTI